MSERKNGKFFCWHKWIADPNARYGRNWDLVFGLRIPAMCNKCGKFAHVANDYLEEVPDHLINSAIEYM